MIVVNAGEQNELAVLFHHARNEDGLPISSKCILKNKDHQVIGEGNAVCSKKDHFRYEAGRKYALSRALQAAGIGRDGRKVIWDTYHARKAS
jgi:hypothetical protein